MTACCYWPSRGGNEQNLSECKHSWYPGSKIRLDGYTDAIGTAAYNVKLSEKRAMAVRDYLIKEAGVDKSKITAVGHGEADPVASNKTKEGRTKNRRTEISILSD